MVILQALPTLNTFCALLSPVVEPKPAFAASAFCFFLAAAAAFSSASAAFLAASSAFCCRLASRCAAQCGTVHGGAIEYNTQR